MNGPDGPEQRTAFYEERAEVRATMDDFADDFRLGYCDVCGFERAIVFRGYVCGIETFACGDCAP